MFVLSLKEVSTSKALFILLAVFSFWLISTSIINTIYVKTIVQFILIIFLGISPWINAIYYFLHVLTIDLPCNNINGLLLPIEQWFPFLQISAKIILILSSEEIDSKQFFVILSIHVKFRHFLLISVFWYSAAIIFNIERESETLLLIRDLKEWPSLLEIMFL